jgi:hypothetical protein
MTPFLNNNNEISQLLNTVYIGDPLGMRRDASLLFSQGCDGVHDHMSPILSGINSQAMELKKTNLNFSDVGIL